MTNIWSNTSLFFYAETCIDGLVGLTSSLLSFDSSGTPPTYLIDGRLRAGRVEVCVNGVVGRVCDDEMWGYEEASTVCNQLGLSPYGK